MAKTLGITIPIWRGHKYLPSILKCLNDQTCRDFDVLFVNDGCPDGDYDTSPYPCIKIQHGTLPVALNAGHAALTNPYLCWWAVDDVYYPNFVERVVPECNGITLITGSHRAVGSRGGTVRHYMIPNAEYTKITQTKTCIYRRDAWERNQYEAEWFLVEDRQMIFKILLEPETTVTYIAEPLADYMTHPHDNLSTTRRDDVRKQLKKLRAIYEPLLAQTKWYVGRG